MAVGTNSGVDGLDSRQVERERRDGAQEGRPVLDYGISINHGEDRRAMMSRVVVRDLDVVDRVVQTVLGVESRARLNEYIRRKTMFRQILDQSLVVCASRTGGCTDLGNDHRGVCRNRSNGKGLNLWRNSKMNLI